MKTPVAKYIEQQIALSDKSQKQIAEECGYQNPNVMSMLKTGSTKVPINKVGLLAKALGVDPRHLLRMTMVEYMPETWEVIEEILGSDFTVSDDEMKIIYVIREAGGGLVPDMSRPGAMTLLKKTLRDITKVEKKSRDATLERYNRNPRNNRMKSKS